MPRDSSENLFADCISSPAAKGAQWARHHARQCRRAEVAFTAGLRLLRWHFHDFPHPALPQAAAAAAAAVDAATAAAAGADGSILVLNQAAGQVASQHRHGGVKETGAAGRRGGAGAAGRDVGHLLRVLRPQDILHIMDRKFS